jgi:hypothetical protein
MVISGQLDYGDQRRLECPTGPPRFRSASKKETRLFAEQFTVAHSGLHSKCSLVLRVLIICLPTDRDVMVVETMSQC